MTIKSTAGGCTIRRRLLAAAMLAGLMTCGAAASASADHTALTVDASHPMGSLKALRGVNGVPDLSFVDLSKLHGPRSRPPDVSAGYLDAKINLVRTHDSQGVGDIDPNSGPLPPLNGPGMGGSESTDDVVIFPNPDADPADPKSYNFGPTDRLIKAVGAIHADVLFRIGRGGGTTAEPPTDLAKYGEILRHIVLHYDRGWDDGFTDSVKYWEVWNEPDLGKIFWRGTPQQYYALYAAAAHAVKAADAKAEVGGPTIALVNQTTPYREGFLDYVQAHHLPLDFFSWHYYSDAKDPYDFVRISRVMRRLLDQHGLRATRSVMDEWNYGLGDPRSTTPAHIAAFVASSVIYMQDAPIDLEALYRADHLFGTDGDTPDKSGQALIALGRMAGTSERLSVRGADIKGLAAEAGGSRDGREIHVLISNYQIPQSDLGPRKGPDVMHVPGLFDLALLPRRSLTYSGNQGYALSIKGLSAKRRYVVERYRISDTQNLSLFDTTHAAGPVIRLQGELPPPGIDLVVIRADR